MALILNIDTATEYASTCLSKDGALLSLATNPSQKDHAAFIQPAIQNLVKDCGYQLSDLDAVAVSNGPGSYTGLRVGLSTAKGICYALNKPLLLLNTLQVMAVAAVEAAKNTFGDIASEWWYAPMIDARRMEVFTAVYDAALKEVTPATALILDRHAFETELTQREIVYTGSGAGKFRLMDENAGKHFLSVQHDASHMQSIAEHLYLLKAFADKAYSEPMYLKEFFTTQGKIKSN